MAALTFLSERLGVSVPDLVAEERPEASRLEADVLLAAGSHQDALDRYDTLLDRLRDDRRQRAEIQRGRAEALCRLGRGADAIAPAAESAELFDALAAPADAAWSRYWLAYASYQVDNSADARTILLDLLTAERAGPSVAPDFRFRVLTALGNVESWDGEPERAIAYLEEARTLSGSISLRQRAAFLSSLALQYRFAGDLERSIRAGHESLALYRAADAGLEMAALENNMGINFVDLGNLERSASHFARARELAADDARLLSEIAEGEARLALARGDHEGAAATARDVIDADGASPTAVAGAHLTVARSARQQGDSQGSQRAYGLATAMLREHGPRSFLREVLGEWAELRASTGDHRGATVLYAEALGRGARRAPGSHP
jgi:tetratricopeptide (TPR) repeat protein